MSDLHHPNHFPPPDELIDTLIHRGLDQGEAVEWVHRVRTNVDDMMKWRKAGYKPKQAEEVTALADESMFAPDEWRDSGLPPEQVIASVRAGVALHAALDGRSTPDALNVLAGLRKADNDAKLRAFRHQWR